MLRLLRRKYKRLSQYFTIIFCNIYVELTYVTVKKEILKKHEECQKKRRPNRLKNLKIGILVMQKQVYEISQNATLKILQNL